jgi:hypothetical protein
LEYLGFAFAVVTSLSVKTKVAEEGEVAPITMAFFSVTSPGPETPWIRVKLLSIAKFERVSIQNGYSPRV